MTEERRIAAARRLRELLDCNVHRKPALLQVSKEFDGIDRSTIYRYCKRYGISTR